MKETITQILNSIDKHIKKEIESGAVNRTIGRGCAVVVSPFPAMGEKWDLQGIW